MAKQAKQPVSQRRFAVAGCYTGECCACAHVWLAVVRAKDEADAEITMRQKIRRAGNEPGDVVAIEVL